MAIVTSGSEYTLHSYSGTPRDGVEIVHAVCCIKSSKKLMLYLRVFTLFSRYLLYIYNKYFVTVINGGDLQLFAR